MGDDTKALPEQPQATKRSSLGEIAILFLRLGTTAFGGPAAHIAIMEDEFVRRRRWITQEKFLDLLGVVNLIPGPNSTEMAVYLGYLRAGWAGLVIAGVCFNRCSALGSVGSFTGNQNRIGAVVDPSVFALGAQGPTVRDSVPVKKTVILTQAVTKKLNLPRVPQQTVVDEPFGLSLAWRVASQQCPPLFHQASREYTNLRQDGDASSSKGCSKRNSFNHSHLRRHASLSS